LLAPRDGVLVLRNGHVVEGRIARQGDRYVVAFGASEVRFPAGDVEFQCENLEEAYFRKRDILDPQSVRQRVELAEWAMRHHLPHRAADQLLAALMINPFEPRAHALRRRLLHSAEARQNAENAVPDPAADIDWQAAERVLEQTPAPAVETFTSGIQIMLLNRCATNACHGNPAVSQFHLLRPLRDKSIPRRLTQRNLYATLQMIDKTDPERSRLLSVPQRPHGGERMGMFDGRSQQLGEQLRDWVYMVVPPPELNGSPEAPSVLPSQPNATSETRPESTVAASNEIHRSVISQRPSTEPADPVAPRDPFDPAIFNRRYFPEKDTPSTEKAPETAASKN
jgi:hypothetical protein